MKIAITGVTGFVGGHLVRRLHAKGHELIGIGRQATPTAALAQLCTYVQADISAPMPSVDCDIAIHSAGLASDRGSYNDFYSANVKGTEHFYQATQSAPVFYSNIFSIRLPTHRKNHQRAGCYTRHLSFYLRQKLKC